MVVMRSTAGCFTNSDSNKGRCGKFVTNTGTGLPRVWAKFFPLSRIWEAEAAFLPRKRGFADGTVVAYSMGTHRMVASQFRVESLRDGSTRVMLREGKGGPDGLPFSFAARLLAVSIPCPGFAARAACTRVYSDIEPDSRLGVGFCPHRERVAGL